MSGEQHLADARREAEEALARARYLISVADETALGEFEEELVECLRALLAAVPETPPPPSDAVREAETPGTTRVEGHDEQATDTGQPKDEAERRDQPGDAAAGQDTAVLGVQPTDGAQADPSTGGVPNSVQILRSRAADGTVATASDAVREAAETHRVEADHRCDLDLLRSARLYFADGHPMRLAIERTLAERPVLSSARGARGRA